MKKLLIVAIPIMLAALIYFKWDRVSEVFDRKGLEALI